MRALLAAALAGMICIAVPASAEQFVLTTMDVQEGRMSAIDVETLRSVGGYKRAWLLIALHVDSPEASYAQELQEFDCVQQRSRLVSMQIFDMADKPTSSAGQEDWQYFTPKSGGDYAMKYACGTIVPSTKMMVDLSASALVAKFRDIVVAEKAKK